MGKKIKLIDASGNLLPKKPKANTTEIASVDIVTLLISNPIVPSDIRLKNILKKLYTTEDGINIYSFIYKKQFGIDGIFQGVIAQELIGTSFEEALVKVGDYYYVNYYKLKEASFERIG